MEKLHGQPHADGSYFEQRSTGCPQERAPSPVREVTATADLHIPRCGAHDGDFVGRVLGMDGKGFAIAELIGLDSLTRFAKKNDAGCSTHKSAPYT